MRRSRVYEARFGINRVKPVTAWEEIAGELAN